METISRNTYWYSRMLILMWVAWVLPVSAQVPAPGDSSVADTARPVGKPDVSYYGGIWGTTVFPIDSFVPAARIDVRLGGGIKWQVHPRIQLYGISVLGITQEPAIYQLHQAAARFKTTDRTFLHAGFIPTVSTIQHRPYPVSAVGHAETWAQAQVIGGAPGLRYDINVADKKYVGLSLSVRNRQPEYSFGFRLKSFSMSGWYRTPQAFGVVASLDTDPVTGTLVFQRDLMACSILAKAWKVIIFTHLGISMPAWAFNAEHALNHYPSWTLRRAEIGIFAPMEWQWLGAGLGLGYAHETRSIKAYVFIHTANRK